MMRLTRILEGLDLNPGRRPKDLFSLS